MKINLLAASAFAAALAMPLGAAAQQTQAPPAATQSYGHRTPSQAKLQRRWMKRLRGLNLSGDQQQRIQSLINQYSQTHPAGSPVDKDANRALRRQVMGVLTSDQQSQLHEQMRQRRAQMQQRRGQTQGSDQQAPGDQQAPPDRQGPPQDQGPNDQGPPPDQAPPNDQAPSNDQPSGPPPA